MNEIPYILNIEIVTFSFNQHNLRQKSIFFTKKV